MPKLLDFIKDKELSHENVMKIIEDSLLEKPEEKTEIPEIKDGEDEEKIELRITDMKTEVEPDASDDSEEEDKEEVITLTPEELAQKISEAVADQLKAKLKVPSKGKLNDKPQATERHVISKNWFEESLE